MTREELREHCEKQIQSCEMLAIGHGKFYEEHKLILELLEQEPRWIPVSERLPEIAEFYLTSIKWVDGTEKVIIAWFDGTSFKAEVKAWMPLPKPYKPQKSEDNEE